MTEFLITSPDGRRFRVTGPEGATQQQVEGYVARQGLPKEMLPSPDPWPMRVLAGVGDPAVGAFQLGAHVGEAVGLPVDTAAIDKFVRDRERKIEQRTDPESKVLGVDPARLAGGMINPANVGLSAASRAPGMLRGAIGGMGGAVTQPTAGPDFWSDKGQQAAIGGGAGAALGMLGRAVTPYPFTPERRALVQALEREGIEPTAGQQSGRKALRYAEGHLGEMPGAGGAAEAANERVGTQFTRAALQRAGITADRATQDVVDQGFRANSNRFNRLAQQTDMRGDRQLAQDFYNTFAEYQAHTPPAARRPFIENVMRDTAAAIHQNNGQLDGRSFQQLRERVAQYERETGDPDYRRALSGIRRALDDAMERSIQATNPRLLGEWRDVRNEFRNLLVIAKASTGAGEATASGLLSPAKIRQAIVSQDRRDYARGRGDFAELTRAGEAILSPLPQSGTAPRIAAGALASGIGAALTGGNPAATIAAPLAPGIAGRLLMSRPVQGYLKNQALPSGLPTGVLAPGAGSALSQELGP
jgi:hypothetical protein